MRQIDRRSFIRSSSAASAAVMSGLGVIGNSSAASSASDTVNVAVVGIRNRGKEHYDALSKIPNVRIAVICDIDQRLLPEAVAEVEKLTGYRPRTETEYRKVLDDRSIDAVTIATPNHWHALQTIWACQAGKDVYVEKPVSHTVLEGRRMVEAARKYNRVVQTGTQARSSVPVTMAIEFIRNSGLGKVYMAKGLCIKPRGSIGHVPDSAIPEGVNWDAFLGPAPYRPFNLNRFHYRWHWFWDTGCGDLGNQGIHQADVARWALNQGTHPVKIQGFGKKFILDSDQETPNIQHLTFEYADGSILQFEVRGLPSNTEAGISVGDLILGSKGWMSIQNEDSGKSEVRLGEINLQPIGYSSYKEKAGPAFSNESPEKANSVKNHFQNFLDCVRSRNRQDLHAEILEGHLSTTLCHLGNIACRLGRTLEFDPERERFVNDKEADGYLTKVYRAPYLLPAAV
jgi:predicted dehydrogenase